MGSVRAAVTATAPSASARDRRAGRRDGPLWITRPRSSATVRSDSASARSRWWSTMTIATSWRSLSKLSNSSSMTAGARPSNGSSSSSTRTSPDERARDRHHLLLAAGEVVGRRVAALARAAGRSRGCARRSQRTPCAGQALEAAELEVVRPPSCRRTARAPAARSRCRGARSRPRAAPAISRRRAVIEPAAGGAMPISVFSSVDLPAPLRPSSATISCSRTSKRDVVAGCGSCRRRCSTSSSASSVVGSAAARARLRARAPRRRSRYRPPAPWRRARVLDGAVDQHAALVHHRDAVGELEHAVDVVLDEQHRDLGRDALDEAPMRSRSAAARPASGSSSSSMRGFVASASPMSSRRWPP